MVKAANPICPSCGAFISINKESPLPVEFVKRDIQLPLLWFSPYATMVLPSVATVHDATTFWIHRNKNVGTLQVAAEFSLHSIPAVSKILHSLLLFLHANSCAFTRAVMEYRRQNRDTYLICSLLGAYPHPDITWTENNATKRKSNIKEISSQPPFSVKSQLNIADSNSSYQCIIENLVLNQRWIGKWKADTLLKKQGEEVLFPCKLENEDFLPEKNIHVIWSKVENTSTTTLASFSSSSSRKLYDSRFSWAKNLTHEKNDFSLTLKSPAPTDNGDYLCNISSVNYTQLTMQFLSVGPGTPTESELQESRRPLSASSQ
ncbi:HERV-H LTR-associating protein 2 [Gracilinanus agilis]|uniref:HERV-H LTR-associating protein 2 n=1 Tax=Gracilinanus agilis TaxID=191870 RepID=UPI001CFE92A7|nr:HERV-H LTR-associating protein 2 [Gracilinanus agilis]